MSTMLYFQPSKMKHKHHQISPMQKLIQNKSRNDEPLSPADSLDQTIISPNMAFSPENQG